MTPVDNANSYDEQASSNMAFVDAPAIFVIYKREVPVHVGSWQVVVYEMSLKKLKTTFNVSHELEYGLNIFTGRPTFGIVT